MRRGSVAFGYSFDNDDRRHDTHFRGVRRGASASGLVETQGLTDKPLISFALFAFTQERFVREAVSAAFAQTYSPLEIILSDDCSPDGTFLVMQEMAAAYAGPHKIVLNRNPRNLGIGSHINCVMEIATGELIVPAAGDDVSLPHRTATLAHRWLATGRGAMSLHSALLTMACDGTPVGKRTCPDADRLNDQRAMARHGFMVLGAGHAWSRSIFERFGPVLPELVNEDIALPFRSALLGRVEYIDEPLVKYRLHQSTWHDFRGVPSSHDERLKRTLKHLKLARVVAHQALIDAVRFGDPEIERLVMARLAENAVLTSIAERKMPASADIRAWLALGPNPLGLARDALKMLVPGFDKAYSKIREQLQ